MPYLRGHRNYTIIDLPFVCALQAAFLRPLGENAVRLYGEDEAAPIVLWQPAIATSSMGDLLWS